MALLAVGSILPEPGTSPADTTSRHLYLQLLSLVQPRHFVGSPLYLTLLFLIFVSTLSCTVRRFARRGERAGGFTAEVSGPAAGGIAWVEAVLAARCWRTVRNGEGLSARKGGWGWWGSILFHAGLLLLMAAGVLSAFTRFNGELLLTEGFPVVLGRGAFVAPPEGRRVALPPETVELRRFIPTYAQGRFAEDFEARVAVNGKEHGLHVNRPLAIGAFQLNLNRYGFAPTFRITDASGRELLNATLELAVVGGEKDSFAIPGTPYRVETRFFPDFVAKGGEIGSQSPLPRAPVFWLTLSANGKRLGRTLVRLGRQEALGPLTVRFSGLAYWVDLFVTRDDGLWLFVAGFIAGLFGLAVRFLLPDKELTVTVAEDLVTLTGWTRYCPAFFADELARLCAVIGEGGSQ